MRSLVMAVLGLAACDRTNAEPPPKPASVVVENTTGAKLSAELAGAPQVGTHELAMDVVALLQTQDVVGARVDTTSLAEGIKLIAETVVAHGEGLPNELDAVVAARPTGLRVWLVGADGDIAAPALAEQLAKLPPIAVRSDVVALAIRFVRAGTPKSGKRPFLPAAWKAQANKDNTFTSIDTLIERAWPAR